MFDGFFSVFRRAKNNPTEEKTDVDPGDDDDDEGGDDADADYKLWPTARTSRIIEAFSGSFGTVNHVNQPSQQTCQTEECLIKWKIKEVCSFIASFLFSIAFLGKVCRENKKDFQGRKFP